MVKLWRQRQHMEPSPDISEYTSKEKKRPQTLLASFFLFFSGLDLKYFRTTESMAGVGIVGKEKK